MFLYHFHKKQNNKYLYPAVILATALVATGIFSLWGKEGKAQIALGGHDLAVTVADSDTERGRGLSGRRSLAENEGMLFIFESVGPQGIWMKDMKFPIDIIWIDENKIVQGITPNVSPDSYPTTFTSPLDVKYVLEVNANWAKQRNLRAGALLELPN